MNTQHTRGPWEYVPKLTASENHRGYFVRAEKATRDGKWALAEVQPGDENGALGEANARLIATAPELLHCLQVICSHAEDRPDLDVSLHLDIARSTIAKALGHDG